MTARRALILISAACVAGCDPSSTAAASSARPSAATAAASPPRTPTAPPPASPPDPLPASCRSAADCGGNRRWCRFDDAGCGPSVHGTCAEREPLCTISHPFCACTGETVGACSHPSVPWSRAGKCDGGTPPRP